MFSCCNQTTYILVQLIDPTTGFSTVDRDVAAKIRQHGWKEHLHIHKVAKFENDLLKTREDLAPQSRRILQMFVLRGGGGGAFPPLYKSL